MIPALLIGLSVAEWVQLGQLLLELYPDAVKLIRAWRRKHGRRLTPAARKELAAELRAGVARAHLTKDTSGLEALFVRRVPGNGEPES